MLAFGYVGSLRSNYMLAPLRGSHVLARAAGTRTLARAWLRSFTA